jgi:hypothetical protein
MVLHRDTHFLNLILVLLTVFCISGCGGAPVPVRGSVTYKGKPIKKGGISFTALDGQMGDSATMNEEIQLGDYEFDGNSRLNPGMYKVEIYGTIDEPVSKSVDPDMQSSGKENSIPAKYNTKTNLDAEVHAKSGPIDFDLEP